MKIGIIGTGKIGEEHLNSLLNIKSFDIVGFYGDNNEKGLYLQEKYNVKYFQEVDSLINQVEVVDIAGCASDSFEIAKKSLKKFKHLYVDRPEFYNVEQGRVISSLAKEADAKVQFNNRALKHTALIKATPYIHLMQMIQCESFIKKSGANTQLSVVEECMETDIRTLINLLKSPVKKVSANGMKVFSDKIDVAFVRLEFMNACVANLQASRVVDFEKRNCEIYQQNGLIEFDLLKNRTMITPFGKDVNAFIEDTVDQSLHGLELFYYHIINNIQTVNSIDEEVMVKEVVGQINAILE